MTLVWSHAYPVPRTGTHALVSTVVDFLPVALMLTSGILALLIPQDKALLTTPRNWSMMAKVRS